MPEGQTSLQEALARIMGAPGGGASAPQSQNTRPYSQDIAASFTPKTSLDITNTPFDPFAGEQDAALAAMRTPSVVAAAPVAAPRITPISSATSLANARAMSAAALADANARNAEINAANQQRRIASFSARG